MKCSIPINYPDDEFLLKKEIGKLNGKWYSFICRNCTSELSSLYVSDGFFPYYTHQKIKILFIGKESRGLAGCDYIEELFNAIKLGKIGEKTLNQHKFHALMLYVVYGLQHNCLDYEKIPCATEISRNFATSNGISYAFMNLSKFSNEANNYEANDSLIDSFLEISSMLPENYFAKEIRILDPNLIIGMNLNEDEKMDRHKFLGDLKNPTYYGNNGQVCAQKLITHHDGEYREYNFIDCYHFSAPNKKWEKDYYSPIVSASKTILHM